MKFGLIRRIAALLCVTSHPAVLETTVTKTAETTSASGHLRDALLFLVQSNAHKVGRYYSDWIRGMLCETLQRSRDLLPLPSVTFWPSEVDAGQIDVATGLDICNMCIAGLNFLSQGMKDVCPKGAAKAATIAQAETQKHICFKVARYLQRLDEHYGTDLPWLDAFTHVEATACPNYESLRGYAVDLPACAGTCDPSAWISPELSAKINDISQIFPASNKTSSCGAASIRAEQRGEYVNLTLRELRCGKLRLRADILGMGGVFAVGKPSGSQRKIWDGSALSELATSPPKPRRLANPSSFLDLELSSGSTVLYSKRDASTYFDSLAVPQDMRPWFGQPPVAVEELVEQGMTMEEIEQLCDDVPEASLVASSELFPVHSIWPMGFSWSSAVAQDTTIGMCIKAGISEDNIMSLDHKSPHNQDEVCFVATDDVVLVHADAGRGACTLNKLDEAFRAGGVQKNAKKDVTLEASVTALGCDLSNNPAKVEPAIGKLGQVICRTLDLLRLGRASPRAVQACLGVWQWFFLMQRSFFSIFDTSYDFVRQEPAN